VPICGAGIASVPKPGAQESVLIGSALIELALGFLAPELIPFAGLIPAYLYIVSTECPNDPPPIPTLDWPTLISDLVAGPLSANFVGAIALIQQAVNNYLWYQFCQCANGQILAPSPILPPTGVGFPVSTPGQPCGAGNWNGLVPPTPPPYARPRWLMLPTMVEKTGTPINITSDPAHPYQAWPIPTGLSSISLHGLLSEQPSCPGAPSNGGAFVFLDATNVEIGYSPIHTFNQGMEFVETINIPGNAVHYFFAASDESPINCSPGNLPASFSATYYCGGATPNQLVSCCPPDETTTTLIQNILNITQSTYDLVLNLGGGGPTGWTDGVRHSALSGSGTFMLSGDAIGVRVEMTTLPSGGQVNAGSPTFYWDAGFITPYAAESPFRGQRLVFQDQVFPLPSFTDQIGYTLLHGTVINVVELLPLTARRKALPNDQLVSLSAQVDS
jgi:hypothetical protein